MFSAEPRFFSFICHRQLKHSLFHPHRGTRLGFKLKMN
jgi:hypothetical protein